MTDMRRVALAAGLIALAASGMGVAVSLPAASAHSGRQSSTPLTITIFPPTTTAAPTGTGAAELLTLFAAGKADTLDARLREPLKTLLASRSSLAHEFDPISASPAAEAVVLLTVLDTAGYPLMNAIAPLVTRMAYDAAHRDAAHAAGVLLSIELLTRATALTQKGSRP